jgi:hypothetical protein
MANKVKAVDFKEHPELFTHLANTIDQVEFNCDLTAASLSDEGQQVAQKVREGLAEGYLYEARPNVYKFTEQGIKNFKENARAKG